MPDKIIRLVLMELMMSSAVAFPGVGRSLTSRIIDIAVHPIIAEDIAYATRPIVTTPG